MFDEDVDGHLGPTVRLKDDTLHLWGTLARMRAEKGNEVSIFELTGTFFILLDLAMDETLIDRLTAVVDELFEKNRLAEFATDQSVCIVPLAEVGDERYRIYLDTLSHISSGAQEDVIYHKVACFFDYVMSRLGELPPFAEELRAWWKAYPSKKYGISKEYY